MNRLVLLAAAMALSAMPLVVQAEVPAGADNYSTELKLKIAIAISPRSPPVTIRVMRSAGARPVIYGTTDLPDGAILDVSLKKPLLPDADERLSIGLPACQKNCFPPSVPGSDVGDRVIIKDGAFKTAPFSFRGAPLDPGVYPLEIVLETGNYSSPAADLLHTVLIGQIIVGPDDR